MDLKRYDNNITYDIIKEITIFKIFPQGEYTKNFVKSTML